MIPRFYLQCNLKNVIIALFGSGSNISKRINCFKLPGFINDDLYVIPTYRGREALFMILKALNLPSKARVGVPLYSCSVVAETVVEAGMKPIFVDADPITFGLNLFDLKKKVNNLDCLILVHMFGYPSDFHKISQIMQGRAIIEDCAHALGSYYKGLPLGTFGKASFFSFGFFKPFSVGGGGCIVTKDFNLFEEIKNMLQKSQNESFKNGIVHIIHCLFYSLAWNRMPYTFLTYLRKNTSDHRIENEGTRRLRNRVISNIFKMRRSDFNVLSFRLSSWSVDSDIKFNFWLKIREIIGNDWCIPPEPAYGQWNHFILPVRAPTQIACENAISRLRSMGIGVARLYPNRAIKLKSFGYDCDCPEAERLSQSIFIIPSHLKLSTIDQKQILFAVKKSLNL